MTIHLPYDYVCPECKADYIPYGMEVQCPCCGLFEDEDRLKNYVPMAVRSCLSNMTFYRRYTPPVWGCSNLSDHLLYWVFCALDKYSNEKISDKSFFAFAAEYAEQSDFTDNEYLRGYMVELATSVYNSIMARQNKERK